MNVATDHKWKQFKCRFDVPKKVLSDQFDYLTDLDSEHFFQYRGCWYHVSEFIAVPDVTELKGWHGFKSDSFYSGVVIRTSKDGEEYMVGTYIS